MKRFLPILLILSFIGIAAFGASFFDMGMGHSGGCVASAIDGTACPTDIMGFAVHHVSALQTLLGTAVPPDSGWILLLASLLFMSVGAFFFYKSLLLPKLELLPQRLRDLSFNHLLSQQKIISWLSLFELSPAL